MNLREHFDQGLTADGFAELLDEKQRDLHALYQRRADISDEAVERFRSDGPARALVITEPWCGDSLALFPVIVEYCERAGIPLRVARRDEHPDLMDQYLTNGGRAVPIAVFLNEQDEEQFHWGPRPLPAQEILERHRQAMAAGTIERTEIYKQIRAFYARDNGRTIIEELVERLNA